MLRKLIDLSLHWRHYRTSGVESQHSRTWIQELTRTTYVPYTKLAIKTLDYLIKASYFLCQSNRLMTRRRVGINHDRTHNNNMWKLYDKLECNINVSIKRDAPIDVYKSHLFVYIFAGLYNIIISDSYLYYILYTIDYCAGPYNISLSIGQYYGLNDNVKNI